MAVLNPANTTVGDLCTEALRECGAIGIGQTPSAEDITGAQTRLQWMLQEWERKRWLVYHLETFSVLSTGAESYTVGPQADIDTGAASQRPNRLEAAYLRNLQNTAPNQIDYPLDILQAGEDYAKIDLKSLESFPDTIYYEPSWPLGRVRPWPVAQASIYSIHIMIREQLPASFASLVTPFVIPYEYYTCMMTNLAIRLRPKYRIPSYPGDMLPMLAKTSLNTIRTSNTQIGRLVTSPSLSRNGIYNIFSDRVY